MVKIEGLDRLQRQLSEAARVLEELDGELGSVRFDPHDPGSIEAAIRQVETMVDSKTTTSGSNPLVEKTASAIKERYRAAILERAAAARLTDGDPDAHEGGAKDGLGETKE